MKMKKMLMMCLLVVAMICASTVRVSALEYQESTTTIFDEGGDYSLYYILNNFNHFVRTNAKAGHTIGAVAVGEDASYVNGNGKQDYTQTTSSYFKGNINAIVADGFFKNLYIGEINRERTYNHQNDEHTFISKNDSYIDFDTAFNQIQNEVTKLKGDIHITKEIIEEAKKIRYGDAPGVDYKVGSLNELGWEITNTQTPESPKLVLKVNAGKSFIFDEGVVSELTQLNLMYPNGVKSETDTMFISNDTGSITMPYIYLNGQYDAINKMGLVGTHEWGEGLSIVTVLPNAKDVKDKDSNQVHIGHVVAPNAYVHNMNGDINGCIVSKSLDVGNGESHMWPYKGHRIQNNNTTPEQPGDNTQGGNENPGENNPGTGNEEKPNVPEQPGDNTQGGNENPGENKPGTGDEEKPSTPVQPGDDSQSENQKPEVEDPKTGNETTDSKSNNDTNSSSTNNEIISNKEELTTNISRKQNTPKISSNKNSKVIVENNKQTNAKQNDSVKTGDDTHLFMYVLLELLAFVGIVSLRKKA